MASNIRNRQQTTQPSRLGPTLHIIMVAFLLMPTCVSSAAALSTTQSFPDRCCSNPGQVRAYTGQHVPNSVKLGSNLAYERHCVFLRAPAVLELRATCAQSKPLNCARRGSPNDNAAPSLVLADVAQYQCCPEVSQFLSLRARGLLASALSELQECCASRGPTAPYRRHARPIHVRSWWI